jgi:hypothetical protein
VNISAVCSFRLLVRVRLWHGCCKPRLLLKAFSRSDRGTMNKALHVCLQTKCKHHVIFEGALVVEGYHAFLCEAEVPICPMQRVGHVVPGFYRSRSIDRRCYDSEVYTCWQLCGRA